MIIIRNIGQCKLCKTQTELKESHIVPKFVGRWLKKTSASGRLRNAVIPNVRIQDLYKEHMLCKICEQRFSDLEKPFANEIFYPFHDDNKKSFHYKSWLKKLAISINWRVAVSKINTNLDDEHPSYPLLEETLEQWRLFLLDEIDSPGPSEHHLLFIGINDIEDFSKINVPDDYHFLNMRFLRSVDFCTSIDEHNRLFIYSCIAGIAFISHIHPYRFSGWTNQSRIKNTATINIIQKNTDTIFGEFLSYRMTMMEHLIRSNISEKQEKIVTNGILDDYEKTLNSKSLGLLNQIIEIETK